MYKSIISIFIALLALAGCNDTSTPKEGDEYSVVATPTENTADVVEIFSLACGHCRNMEMMLPEIKKMAGVEIDKVHVTFNQSAQGAAYIFYTAAAQTNGTPDAELMEALFAYIQDTSDNVTNEQKKQQLQEIFKTRNLTSPFDLTNEQHELVYKQLLKAEELVNNAQISSVPAFLVKGKYLVNTGAHENLEDMSNTIRYLAALEN